jgi:hypothetical protein
MYRYTTACHSGEVPVTTTKRVHGENYARCVTWSAAAAGGGAAQLYSGGWDGAVRVVAF